MQPCSELSDAEYLAYLEADEGRCNGLASAMGLPLAGAMSASSATTSATTPGGGGAAANCLDVLSAALVALKDTRHERMRSRLGLLMAQEYVVAGNLAAARKLLLQVCYAYRRCVQGALWGQDTVYTVSILLPV